ncbi:hypothetical protein ASE63_00165 [Bosea sp. Root381]|uniref:nucleotidyltransferase domain-containing protein n=1 Tax=Bosea sp. Root381 TaxID=1736524 RepID=UPI0006FF8BCA|nr:nucleotidyltransferase domain-containing protein [Bosea sp. Root381]KRE17664.1 hypothetical protein ASE63_00165 [Bosea sp. Root381]
MSIAADLLSPPDDATAAAALEDYAERVRESYGARLVEMHLFGSRARGTARPDSDADVAVVLSAFEGGALSEKMHLVDLGFDALTDAGLMIQPWPFTEREWRAAEPQGRFGALLAAARRDARPLGAGR